MRNTILAAFLIAVVLPRISALEATAQDTPKQPKDCFTLSVGRKYIHTQSPTTSTISLTTSVRVQLRNGASIAKVQIKATGAADGITLKLAQDSSGSATDTLDLDPGKAATLTIEVGTTALPGEYPIDIDASSEQADQNCKNKNAQTILAVGVGGDFDLVLGIGSLILRGDVTDYKADSQNSILQTTHLGRATPQLLTGGAFKLPFGNFNKGAKRRFGERPWYAFLSLKFSPESSQTFSGYVVGGSYKLSKIFSILAGYSLTPVQEPSPGFSAAAVQVVSQNPNVPAYQRFNVDDLRHNRLDAFDGFPLFVQNASGPTTTRLFSGDPTVIHYHGGFVIGVAIPISLRAQFGGK